MKCCSMEVESYHHMHAMHSQEFMQTEIQTIENMLIYVKMTGSHEPALMFAVAGLTTYTACTIPCTFI